MEKSSRVLKVCVYTYFLLVGYSMQRLLHISEAKVDLIALKSNS